MHKIICYNFLSLVPAVCIEKCTTLGYLLQRQDLEDHQGIKDMARCIWCSPCSQSKHPAPLMILRSQRPKLLIIASLYCLMCNQVGMKQTFIYIYVERYIEYKTCCQKEQVFNLREGCWPWTDSWSVCISFTAFCGYWGFLCWLQFISSIN